MDAREVGAAMAATEGVVGVHDLHLWTITSGFPALSAHVLVAAGADCHAIRRELEALLRDRFELDAHDAPGRARARAARLKLGALGSADYARERGKTAIVTGASSGIGAAIVARRCAPRAPASRAARGASSGSTRTSRSTLDVTDAASCERFVAARRRRSSAGSTSSSTTPASRSAAIPFDESTEEDEETVLETNVHGLMRMTRLCLPHLRDGGHIVNMGSVAGRQAYPNGSSYVTSKFAVHGFTHALREDLLGRPIRDHDVDAGPRRDRVLASCASAATRRRRKSVYEGIALGGHAPRTSPTASCSRSTRPPHVNVDEIVVKALAQSSGARILRD